MTLANCSRCGLVFSFAEGGLDICALCLKEEEDNYRKVFQFLSTRPGATAQEISEATEIDIKVIYRFVRENRLRLAKVDTGLACESCGVPIPQGKVCEKCFKKLSQDIKNDIDKFKKDHKASESVHVERPDPKYLKERRGKSTNS